MMINILLLILIVNKCKLHKKYYESYCTKCIINLCSDCEHDECKKSGSIQYYRTLKSEKNQIEKIENEIKDLKKNDKINEIIKYKFNNENKNKNYQIIQF